ncbi:hypothetical protein SAMN05216326_11657 [Nitrosomonas marina]|uniref:Uncharacterized protein n=1 Tax=Nitrosomonas marina TaxID=917 RepID=A0A1I0CUY4_9PROT|nr:hypothetical protein [Nitrosomonas marina]SET23637.1 hypothetical protein SAMN05216326_11657 [Nitrosomonas marina]
MGFELRFTDKEITAWGEMGLMKRMLAQWDGLLPLNGIAMCQTKDFSNLEAGGDYDYNTDGN